MRERGAIRVGELRGLTAELARGSARAELLWNGGSTARVSLLALRVERRRRSGAWERGMSERARGMGFWGSCNARARARRGRRPLQRARHRGGEVAAARAVLGSAGRVARQGRLQREATGGGGGAARRVGASAKQDVAGLALHGAGGSTAQRRHGKTEQAGWKKGIKDLNAISKNSRDPNVNQR